MEIRAYVHNGTGWEWDGTAWEAAEFSTEGNFSAYADGEAILLRGFDNGDLVEMAEGVVSDWAFT